MNLTLFRRTASWLTEPDDEPASPTKPHVHLARLATRTASLLLAFLFVQRVIVKVSRLPEEAFGNASILFECARQQPLVFSAGLLVGACLLGTFPRLRQGWDQFEGGVHLRWFIGVLAGVLAWAGSAYAYNAWYDEFHAIDRMTLVLLAGLVWWRPVFALPFAAAFWAVIWQLNHPPLGFGTLQAEFKPVVNTITLFSSALLIRGVLGGRRMDGFLFLTLCLVAANFWVPGYGKVRMNWVTHGHTYLLLPDAYTHGWLAFLEPQTLAAITRSLAVLDWPMRLGVLAIECGALLVFVHVRIARHVLLLFTLLLGAFFLTIGYLFWKWMILQGALWILLFGINHPSAATWRRHLFTRSRFVASLIVIGASGVWFHPARLAWFDTPLASTLRYEAIGVSGAAYDLPPAFFAPYESHIAMARFVAALTPAPVLTDSYGVTRNRPLAEALLRARASEEIAGIERAAGSEGTGIDTRYARLFDEFLRRSAQSSNRGLAEGSGGSALLSLVRPPPFLWTFQRGKPYRHEEPMVRVRVYRVSSFFDGRDYNLFRRELLRTIDIGP